MQDSQFDSLVEEGRPTGEVVAVDKILVKVEGLSPVSINALVLFSNGEKGVVRSIGDDHVLVLSLSGDEIPIGALVVVQYHDLVTKVSENYIGRVISVTGKPLDGKGPILAEGVVPVFQDAPPLIEREELNDQLPTGVTVVDTLFPVVLGQRIAIMGDSKSGKSTFTTQLGMNQKGSDRIVIYAMIAKRRADVDTLIYQLEESGAIENSIVVVASSFDSLVQAYLCPYVACAIGEHLWKEKDRDVVLVYDDLTAHARIYREISLLAGVSPGRDSYPGDMFYAHSSLLERAGRLAKNKKSLTALPIVLAANGDITSYLPTNIMSITDGQIIFDLDVMHEGVRPAVNTGLSVSRVGGKAQSDRHKQFASQVFKRLAEYREAAEFSHFGSELALEARKDLQMGERILDVLKQPPQETFPLLAQQLVLDVVLNASPEVTINVNKLKQDAQELVKEISNENDYQQALSKLKEKSKVELKR